MDYKENILEYNTEVGIVEIIHMYNGVNVEVEVWVNRSKMYVPFTILKQPSDRIIRHVVRAVNAGRKLGLDTGIYATKVG